MSPGTPCFFRGEHTCTIYERRPEHPCRNFVCGWLQPGSPFPEDFRPDKLGVMVIPMKWRGHEAYVLRSCGRDPDERPEPVAHVPAVDPLARPSDPGAPPPRRDEPLPPVVPPLSREPMNAIAVAALAGAAVWVLARRR